MGSNLDQAAPCVRETEPCDGWQAARARLGANANYEERAALSPLLYHVELAWDVAEELDGWSDHFAARVRFAGDLLQGSVW